MTTHFSCPSESQLRHSCQDDLRELLLVVAAVAVAHQAALLTSVVADAHVVQDRRPVAQMPFGQLGLDAALPLSEPVERPIEIVLGDLLEAQLDRQAP